MLPDDLYALESAGDPRLSPDGRMVAYVVQRVDREANAYRSAIYVVPSDGSSPPRMLSSGEKEDASPCWSPDGRSLAFVSNREGEKKQLYVVPLDGGDPRRLTDLAEDVREIVWSPLGDRLAFSNGIVTLALAASPSAGDSISSSSSSKPTSSSGSAGAANTPSSSQAPMANASARIA